MLDIPGVREAGWDTASLGITTVRELSHEIGQMQRELMEIWRKIDSRDVNKVFAEPVTEEIAPDYNQVIDNPMGEWIGCESLLSKNVACHLTISCIIFWLNCADLSTIRERIMSGDYYRTKDMMLADVMLMLQNCKKYNEGTQFVKYVVPFA